MANIEASSKLTSKNQTTIPTPVRKALELSEGDRIGFRILDGGRVELFKETSVASDDLVVAAYLSFLERDLIARPSKLSVLEQVPGNRELLEGVDVDDWLAED